MGNPYDIPDDDPEYQALLKQYGVGAPQAPQQEAGFKSAFKNALGSQVQGAGQIAADLGWQDNPIERYGKSVQDANPMSIRSLGDIVESPWQATKEGTGMALGYIAPAMVGRGLQLAGGAMKMAGLSKAGVALNTLPAQAALAAVPSYGGTREEQEAGGHNDLADIGMAALGAGTVGAIETKFGAQKMLGLGKGAVAAPTRAEFVKGLGKTPLATMGKVMGRTVAEEMGEELAQNPIEQLASYQNPLTAENINETLTGSALAGLGTIGLGGAGGARMAMRHKGINDFRQQDLLNPNTPLDMLNDQAEWNKAFIERDQGAEAGQRFYDQRQTEIDQYVESLVDPYRRQAFADQNRQIDLLADQERIAARAPSYLGQQSDYNPDDERVLNAVDRPNPADYRNWWENVPDPNNPEAYQQFWQHVTDGQESVRDVKRDALGTPLNQELPPGYTPVSFRSNGNAATQVAQESGQGASGVAGGSTGDTQDQSGVGRGGNELAAAPVLGSGTDQSVGDTRVGNGAGVNVTEPAQVVAQAQKANDAKAGTKSGTPLAAQGVKPGTKGALEAAVTELMPEESTERQDHINAIQTAKSYTAARKALAKMSPQGLKIALRSAPQEEQRVVQTALGWDSQGNQVGSRIASYADVAKASGLNSRQRVQQILKSYGIDSDVINRMNAADQQSVSVSELMPSQQEDGGAQDGTGFRIMDNPNASDDIVDDRKTRIETHLANKFAAEQGVTAKDLAQGVETDDTVQTAEEVAREDRIAEAANSQREEMLREVASDYNSDIEEGDAPFERLDTDLQEKYIDAFEDFNEDKISARDLMRIFSEVADEAKARNAVRGGNQNRLEGRTNPSGQLPSLVQSKEALLEQAQDTSRAEQTSSTEGSERVKYSKLADELAQWKQAVNDWVSGKTPRTSSPVVFSSTPASLQALGLPNLEVRAAGGHFIEDSLYDHGVKSSQLVEVVRDITDPVAVYAYTGSDGKFSLNIVTRQFVGGNRLVVALQPSKYGVASSPVHFTATVFGRSDATIGGHLQKGMVYQGVTEDMSPELKSATVEYKKKHGQTAIDLSATHNGKFDNLPRSGKLAYKSDLVKLIAEGKAQYSTGVQGSTQAAAIEGKLKPLFFSSSRFSNRVVVVQSAAALPQNLQSSIDGNTQAFVQGGKVYMIADNIAEGKELAVFLHEVGVHLGMKGLIGQENLNRLAMQIKRWAVKNDGSTESEIAKKALSRVKSAQQGGVDMELGDVIEERVAYFVEEAVNAGINPTALSKSGGPLQQWFRTLWAAVKVALRKFGLDRVHTLTAQNLVDLSYGAARLELEGTWHGTAADFRNFNHSYMGSGEGAQAFGWGTYLAQRVGIAKGYWEDDVRRKGGGNLEGGKFVDRKTGEVVTFDGSSSWLPREDVNDITDAMNSGDDARIRKVLTNTLHGIIHDADWKIEELPRVTKGPEGSLMRVDTAVHDDEMLDWDKPLSEQSEAVKKALASETQLSKVRDGVWRANGKYIVAGNGLFNVYNDWEDDYPTRSFNSFDDAVSYLGVNSGSGESIYHALTNKYGSDKAASEYLDSIGIKGIKFLDSVSRWQPKVHVSTRGYVVDASGTDITSTTGPKGSAHHYLIRAEGDYEKAFAGLPTWDKHGRKELENMQASGVSYAESSKFYVDNVNDPFATQEEADAYVKSLALDQTRNLVIFNDKNIQRVVTQVGADRERIKFSKSSNIAQTNPQYRKTSTLVRQALEYLGNKFQSVENNTMFGHQLAQKAEQLMPGTSRYFKSLIQRQTERVKHEQEIARIANRYNELETRDQNALNAFVQKSTMDGKWGFKPTWFEKDVQTPVDQTMKAEFDKLTPEAQQIAKDMFKFGSEQQKRFDTSVNANITDPKKKVPRNQMYGKPYAPLKRFGDHVVVGKSAEFVAEEKAHPGSKRLEEMKADENHYYVEFTDGNWESIKRRDEMAATNPNMTWDSKPLQLENRALNSVNMTILEKLKNQIEASGNKSTDATKGALKSLANQLYIQQLNQMHANKSQAKRLKVKGAEADMMKAFVSQGRAEAALIANLMTHAESEAGLQQIQTAARTGDNQDAKTRVANAVLRRHLAMLDFQPTPIQNKLMGANSFMMLLTSPAYYLTNATQPFVVSMPYMAGRFGGANSWNTLRDAYKTTLELVKLSTLFKDQNLDAAHLKKFNSVGREAEALQVLLDENLVNVGMEMELGDIASQSKNPAMKNLQKGLQVLKTGVANVEVLNRLSTAVAAYRLAYAEALNKGSSKDAAHEAGTSYARQTIIDTHGDYAGYNAPTVMMQGAFGSMPVKLMTQFKKFQFIQAGLLIGTFRDAYLRGNLNENEKAAAKAMFKWMLGTQAALAGALGGVTGVPMALLGAMVAGVFGDDGEDKEAFLRRILGGGAFAQLILHGAPAAAGVDISKRVGMGAALDPFRMADPQTDWSDYALSLAGPSAGLASRTASGLNYIGKGQYWKGLEMLMPSGVLTNASKIARYEAEGLTNSRGDVVMKPEEISLMTDLMQGLGLETTQLSDRRWKAGAIYDRGIHFKEKTSQLQRQYVDAFKDGDREELTAIRQEWMKLQAERVNQGFKRENMTALTQAPMAQKKRERETVNGLQTTQTNKQFVESMDAL